MGNNVESRNGSPVIQAQGLTAGYAGVPIIRDVDLEVHEHEVVALLGPNGAGKTTTLLALAGSLRCLAGTVRWNGSEMPAPLQRRARDGLAYLPEGKSVIARLTAAQNLAISRPPAPDEVLAMFPELRDAMGRRGGQLSGGEQRMLGVGRALGAKPRLLLADELSLGLAPKTVGRILRVIREAADAGLAALIVEQHVHRALEVADRVYVMHGGRIQLSMSSVDAASALDEISASYLAKGAGGRDRLGRDPHEREVKERK
jgi:ABC-type branched-subunit amino acid transport system ATPase component